MSQWEDIPISDLKLLYQAIKAFTTHSEDSMSPDIFSEYCRIIHEIWITMVILEKQQEEERKTAALRKVVEETFDPNAGSED